MICLFLLSLAPKSLAKPLHEVRHEGHNKKHGLIGKWEKNISSRLILILSYVPSPYFSFLLDISVGVKALFAVIH
mgnify:CR=1 FL=1